MNERMIIDAYCRIRTIDNTIPDDVLDFMKGAALEKLKEIEDQGKYNLDDIGGSFLTERYSREDE